jgi:hypothetical protein
LSAIATLTGRATSAFINDLGARLGSGVALKALCGAVWSTVTHESGRSGATHSGEAAVFTTIGDLTAALKGSETDPVKRTVLPHVIAKRADQK